MTVPVSSKNPERAFMLLDKLKNDQTYYELFQMGIKGNHWIAIDDKRWKEGPDFAKYSFNANGQWGVNNSNFRKNFDKEGAFAAESELDKLWSEKAVHPKLETYVFNETNVKNELAAMATVNSKYLHMLALGLADDVYATLKEWQDQVEKAGLKKVEEEVKRQVQVHLEKQ